MRARKRGSGSRSCPERAFSSRARRLRKWRAKFRVSVPAATLARLPEEGSPDGVARGVELFQELSAAMRKYGAPGVHVYVISDTNAASAAIQRART